jgi:DNA-binding protein Fis
MERHAHNFTRIEETMPLTWTLKQWLQTKRGLNFTTNRPLTHLNELQEIIKHRTGNKLRLSTLHNLLEKQPKTLDYRILQIICDAFQCQLKHFCAVKPSSRPTENRRDVSIQHLLQPCAIAGNESLRSFITRVQLAAISQALLMTDNFSQAARLLGSNRVTLLSIRRRNQHAAKNQPPSTDKAIPLPAAIFTIRENEDFDSFKRRIQLAVITETIKLEGGNHTRAALRLGYQRSTLHRIVLNSVENNSTAPLLWERANLFRADSPTKRTFQS